MTWFTILKAVGNWTNMFKVGKFPSESDIKSLDNNNAKTLARELSTTIDRIESELENIPDKRPAVPEGIVQMLLFPRKGKGVTKSELNRRLDKLKSFQSMFDVETHTKSSVKEILQPLVDTFSNSKNIEDFYKLYKYLYKITSGNLNNKSKITQKWMRKLNVEDNGIINVPDTFGSAIDSIKLLPDIVGNIDKHVSSILGFKYQSGNKDTIREVRGASSDKIIDESDPLYNKKLGGLQTKKDRLVSTNLNTTTVKNIVSEPAYATRNLLDKIGTLSLPDFRKLIKVLHMSGVTKGHILEPYKGTSIDILHDIAITGQRSLNNTMRVVDFGRKGLTIRHRKAGYKTDFAIHFINQRMKVHDEEFEIGNYELIPSSLLSSATANERKEHEKNKVDVENYIKRKINSESGQIYDEFRKYVTNRTRAKVKGKRILDTITDDMSNAEKNIKLKEYQSIYTAAGFSDELGAKKVEFYLGKSDGSIQYNDIVEVFGINQSDIFKTNLFAYLFKIFVNSDNESEFENKIKSIITLKGKTGKWREFIPSGKVFQVTDEESFIDSIRTILTFIVTFYDKSMLMDYNESMTDISQDYYINVETAIEELAEEMGMDKEEERDVLLELISEGVLETFGLDKHINSLFGINDSINVIKKTLNELLLDLDEKVSSVIYDLIIEIGKDTSDKYTKSKMTLDGQPKTAQAHLINMKLLQKEIGGEEE